jgi:hypothetical protein
MTINLWHSYKSFYQRSYRSNESDYYFDLKNEMTRIAHDIVHLKLTNKELLTKADKLYRLEVQIYPRVFFSKNIITAVKKNNFYIEIPDEINHKNIYKNIPGHIYIFTSSKTKSGQSKIGATVSMSVEERALKYSEKYGYTVNIFYQLRHKDPFTLEDTIKKKINDLKVTGNVNGDSIEWYYIEPSLLKKTILNTL